jgi:hypothetical protein
MSLSIRVVIAGLLLLAGCLKLVRGDVEQQHNILEAAGIPRLGIVRAVIRGLPAVEVALALWLLSAWNIAGALIATIILIVSFLVVTTLALANNYEGGCGCFGNGTEHLGVSTIILDGVLVLWAAGALYAESSSAVWRSAADVTLSEIASICIIGGWLCAVKVLISAVEYVFDMLDEGEELWQVVQK